MNRYWSSVLAVLMLPAPELGPPLEIVDGSVTLNGCGGTDVIGETRTQRRNTVVGSAERNLRMRRFVEGNPLCFTYALRVAIDEDEAFWAMFRFLNDYADRTDRPEELTSLLSSLRTELFNDGRPADRPMWVEWLASVEATRGSTGREPPAAETEPPESSTYNVIRHASIAGRPAADGLAWVVVTRWQFEGDQEEWHTEYWDHVFNEEAPEEQHASCNEAVEHSAKRFGAVDWLPGRPRN